MHLHFIISMQYDNQTTYKLQKLLRFVNNRLMVFQKEHQRQSFNETQLGTQ